MKKKMFWRQNICFDVRISGLLIYLVSQGDEDANVVQQFERDFAEMLQETPDLQQAMVSYQEARQRITDRRRGRRRGFWPTGKSKGKGGRKSRKDELLAQLALQKRIASFAAPLGHWRAESPQKKDARETANVVQSVPSEASDAE